MRIGGSGTTGAVRRLGALAAALVPALAATLFVLRPMSIEFPAGGLDSSWVAVLGEAATYPARWGVDVVFTYGPASALVTRYYTDAYLATVLPVLLATALVFGFVFARLVALAGAGRRVAPLLAAIAVVAECAALAADLAQDQDGFVFAFALALYLLDLRRRPDDGASRSAVLAAALMFGVLALSKTSYGIVGFSVCVLADARRALVDRRWPVLAPLVVAAFLAAFLACGQHLADLPVYLGRQGDEATGYGEAMYLVGSRRELAGFLGAAAGLVAVALAAGAPGRAGRLFAGLGAALVLLIALKAGFVRADSHTQIGWSALGLAGLVVAVGLVLPRARIGAALLGLASIAVLWTVAPLYMLASSGVAPVPSHLGEIYADMRDGLRREAGAWAALLRDPQRFAAEARAAKGSAWAAVAARQPLPKLAGGVDILPSDQSAVLANGLAYRHRPSFQEYSTYTAGLIAANQAFYRGPEAPDWVLFGGGGLDDRYPTATEGALWPELLRRYEPTRDAGPWLALHRRPTPLPDVLGPTRTIAATLGEPVSLAEPGPVFAHVTVAKTLLGRLAGLVFRPPTLTLHVATGDGQARDYRFIPALGAGGFLLSPLADGNDAFAELGFGNTDDLGGRAVTAITVGGSRFAGWFYDRSVSVDVQPVSVAAVPPSPEARGLFDDLARERPWRLAVIAAGRARDLSGDRLAANAPNALVLPVGTARHLRVAFGIEDGAWRDGTTQGVCFAVAAASGDGAPLWRRCLDPRDVPADRGRQTTEIELPPGTGAVRAETTCLKSCDWGWSYWDDVTPQP